MTGFGALAVLQVVPRPTEETIWPLALAVVFVVAIAAIIAVFLIPPDESVDPWEPRRPGSRARDRDR